MMQLSQVELFNFKCYEHVSFTFAEGMNLITGSNGAGKSTIVEAISWGLFGVKPALLGKATNLIKDGVEPSRKNKAGVVVTFTLDDTTYLVERYFVTGGAVELTVTVKGECVAGPAVTHAQAYLDKLLSLNSKLYPRTIYVTQKEVDELLLGDSAGLYAFIESLLGVQKVNEELTSLAEDNRVIKRSLKNIQFNPELKETLKKEWKEQVAHLKQLKAEQATQLEQAKTLQVSMQQVNNTLSNTESAYLLYNKTGALLDLLKEQLKEATGAVKTVEVELKRLKEQTVLQGGLTVDLSLLQEEHSTLQAQLYQLEQVKAEMDSYTPVGDNKVNSEDSPQSGDSPRPEDLPRLEIELEQAKKQLITLESERAQVAKKIHNLTVQTAGVNNCPTCDSPLTEEHKTSLLHKWNEEVTELEVKSNQVTEQVSTLQQLVTQATQIQNWLASKCEYEKLVGQYGDLPTVKLRLDSNTTLLKRAGEHLQLTERLKATQKEMQTVLTKKATLTTQVIENKKIYAANELGFKEYSKAAQEKETLQRQVNLVKDKVADNRVKQANAKAQLTLLKRQAEEYKQQEEQVTNLTNTLTTWKQVEKELSRFKQALVDNSLPELNRLLSDSLDRVTNGRLTGFKLTAAGEINLLKDGKVNTLAMLSGGELSCVALLLRVKLIQLAGYTDYPLIIDEPFTAQDADRVMNLVQELKAQHHQLIVIAHNGHIDDVADNVINL